MNQAARFRSSQWRTLFLTMFCSLFIYLGWQNFGFAAKGMQAELRLTATQLGMFSAALLTGYGLGQAINGNLADIFGARRMVAIGAVLSFLLNWDWALCSEWVGRERAGTATGLTDASAFATLGQVGIGYVIDKTRTTTSAFVVIVIACLVGALTIVPVKKSANRTYLKWRWRPCFKLSASS